MPQVGLLYGETPICDGVYPLELSSPGFPCLFVFNLHQGPAHPLFSRGNFF